MVCLDGLILKKSEHFEEFYKTPKPVSKMTNKEIKNYLGSYGEINDNDMYDFDMPWPIASPIDKPGKGLEFKSGEIGDIHYSGIVNGMYGKEFSDVEAHSYLGRGAYFENRKINIDTYFNKVLHQAWRRGIVKLDKGDRTIFLNDLISLRVGRAFTRDSIRNREFKRRMDELLRWQRESEKSMKNSLTLYRVAV